MVAGDPGRASRITLPSWVQLLTGWPSKAITWSPTRSPASLAGEALSDATQTPLFMAVTLVATQELTVPSWVVLSFSMPTPSARPKISRKASRKCMNEPAASTTIRCQAGCRRNDLGSSSGSTSSSEVMPTILTKPPNGSALIPYSVSPRQVDHSVGPKPTKYLVTFMPNFFAVTKCPVSCSMTEKSRATMKMTQPIRSIPPSFPQELSSRARRRAQSSTASTSATVVTFARATSCSESIRATVSTMRGKPIWPVRKPATHASFAAL